MPEVRAGGAKWKQRASQARQDYLQGVQRPRRRWAEATLEGVEAYNAGIQEAIAQGRFAAGVQKAGDQKYQQGVQTVGPARYVEGINRSGDAYDKGFAPYRQTLQQLQLPPRGRRGDPANYLRSQAVGEALNQTRQQIKGQGS